MYEPSGKVTKIRENSGKNQGIYTSLFGGHPEFRHFQVCPIDT